MLKSQEEQILKKATKRVGRITTARIGNYVVLERLGSGGDGHVYLGRHYYTLEKVALKLINKNQGYKKIKRARREYCILGQMNHPNIIKLLDVIENQKMICMVMEYAPGGDLFDYIAKFQKLDQQEAWRIFKQLVTAVGYMHSQGFIHRDIKPENIFLDSALNVKLGDFGYASSWSSLKRRHRSCGSVMYASPEIVTPFGSYVGPEVDCWSLGACLYTMLTNQFPFDGSDASTVRHKISTGAWHPSPSFCYWVKDLLDSLLALDPLKRATIRDVLKHPWIVGREKKPLRRRRSAPHLSGVARLNKVKAAPVLPIIVEE